MNIRNSFNVVNIIEGLNHDKRPGLSVFDSKALDKHIPVNFCIVEEIVTDLLGIYPEYSDTLNSILHDIVTPYQFASNIDNIEDFKLELSKFRLTNAPPLYMKHLGLTSDNPLEDLFNYYKNCDSSDFHKLTMEVKNDTDGLIRLDNPNMTDWKPKPPKYVEPPYLPKEILDSIGG